MAGFGRDGWSCGYGLVSGVPHNLASFVGFAGLGPARVPFDGEFCWDTPANSPSKTANLASVPHPGGGDGLQPTGVGAARGRQRLVPCGARVFARPAAHQPSALVSARASSSSPGAPTDLSQAPKEVRAGCPGTPKEPHPARKNGGAYSPPSPPANPRIRSPHHHNHTIPHPAQARRPFSSVEPHPIELG